MCFYEQIIFACGDHRWGRFRQHCNREYRTGETCGMRLVMDTTQNYNKCTICQKIDIKHRRLTAAQEKVDRWRREGGRTASIEKAEEEMDKIDGELAELYADKDRRQRTL
jgi:hypothetical protein